MKPFIDALLKIDREAQLLLDGAQEYSEQVQREIETQKTKLREQCEQKANHRIESARAEAERQSATAIAEIQGRYARLSDQLRVAHDAARERWVEELYSRVI